MSVNAFTLFMEIFKEGCLCLKIKDNSQRFIKLFYNHKKNAFTYKTRWKIDKIVPLESILSCSSEHSTIKIKYKDIKGLDKTLLLGLPNAYKATFICNIINSK